MSKVARNSKGCCELYYFWRPAWLKSREFRGYLSIKVALQTYRLDSRNRNSLQQNIRVLLRNFDRTFRISGIRQYGIVASIRTDDHCRAREKASFNASAYSTKFFIYFRCSEINVAIGRIHSQYGAITGLATEKDKSRKKGKSSPAKRENFCTVHFTASEVLAACVLFKGLERRHYFNNCFSFNWGNYFQKL